MDNNNRDATLRTRFGAQTGQAFTEYVVILSTMAFVSFAGFYVALDTFRGTLRAWYASLANYLNLPFF